MVDLGMGKEEGKPVLKGSRDGTVRVEEAVGRVKCPGQWGDGEGLKYIG
jgi:hypothetical protein